MKIKLVLKFIALVFVFVFFTAFGIDAADLVSIENPAAGESIRADTVYDIKYDTQGTIQKIDLYYHNGSYYQEIETDIDVSGTYTWHSPDELLTSTRIMFKVEDQNGDLSSVFSDTFVIDNTFPSVEWLQPQPGSYLVGNVLFEVEASDQYSGIDEIHFLLNCDTELIVRNEEPYSFEWNSAVLDEDTYTVCAVAKDRAHISHVTTAEIEVERRLPSVKIIYPDSTTALAGGKKAVIEWQSDTPGLDLFNRIRLEYTVSGGDSYNDIAVINDPEDEGSYEWDVPEYDTDLAGIRLSVFEDSGTGDKRFTVLSDTFIIDSDTPAVELIFPDTGSYWLGGETETIVWEKGEPGISGYDYFQLRYQEAPGKNWDLIDTVTVEGNCSGDTCEYDWQLPGGIISDSVTVWIRSLDKAQNAANIYSEYFSIGVKPGIQLQHLSDGDTIGYNDYKSLLVSGEITGDRGYVSALKLNATGETVEVSIESDNMFYELVSYEQEAETDTVTAVTLNIWIEDIDGEVFEEQELKLWIDLIYPNITLEQVNSVDPEKNVVPPVDTGSYRSSDTSLELLGSVDKPYFLGFNHIRVNVNENSSFNLELFKSGTEWVFDERSGEISLDTGINEVEIVYIDSSGNDTKLYFTVEVDNEPPPLKILEPENQYTSDTEIYVKIGSYEYAQQASIAGGSWANFMESSEEDFAKERGEWVELDSGIYHNDIEIRVENDVGMISDTVFTVYYNPKEVYVGDLKPDVLIRGDTEFSFSLPVHNKSDSAFELSEAEIKFKLLDYSANSDYDTQITGLGDLLAGDSRIIEIKVSDFKDTSDSVGVLLELPGEINDLHKRRIIEYEDINLRVEIKESPDQVELGTKAWFTTKIVNDSPWISLRLASDSFAEVISRESFLDGDTDLTGYFSSAVEKVSGWKNRGDSSVLYIEHSILPANEAPLGEVTIDLNPLFEIEGLFSGGRSLASDTIMFTVVSDSDNPVMANIYHYYDQKAGAPGPADPNRNNPVYFFFDLDQSEDVELYLYTLTGEFVWSKKIVAKTGENSIEWYGRNNSGNQVASGGYIYHLKLSDDSSVDYLGKIAIYRR